MPVVAGSVSGLVHVSLLFLLGPRGLLAEALTLECRTLIRPLASPLLFLSQFSAFLHLQHLYTSNLSVTAVSEPFLNTDLVPDDDVWIVLPVEPVNRNFEHGLKTDAAGNRGNLGPQRSLYAIDSVAYQQAHGGHRDVMIRVNSFSVAWGVEA
jgi:hypothetical protein